jgi:hypothetical protein
MMEVKILSELDHPNIVKLEGFYKERQVIFSNCQVSNCYWLPSLATAAFTGICNYRTNSYTTVCYNAVIVAATYSVYACHVQCFRKLPLTICLPSFTVVNRCHTTTKTVLLLGNGSAEWWRAL